MSAAKAITLETLRAASVATREARQREEYLKQQQERAQRDAEISRLAPLCVAYLLDTLSSSAIDEGDVIVYMDRHMLFKVPPVYGCTQLTESDWEWHLAPVISAQLEQLGFVVTEVTDTTNKAVFRVETGPAAAEGTRAYNVWQDVVTYWHKRDAHVRRYLDKLEAMTLEFCLQHATRTGSHGMDLFLRRFECRMIEENADATMDNKIPSDVYSGSIYYWKKSCVNLGVESLLDQYCRRMKEIGFEVKCVCDPDDGDLIRLRWQ